MPLISPVFALMPAAGAHLPACCRRNGAHRCTLMQTDSSSATKVSQISQRCPAYPAVVVQMHHRDWNLQATSLIFGEIVSHPAVHRQTEARARVALDRSRHKRGPPTQLL